MNTHYLLKNWVKFGFRVLNIIAFDSFLKCFQAVKDEAIEVLQSIGPTESVVYNEFSEFLSRVELFD